MWISPITTSMVFTIASVSIPYQVSTSPLRMEGPRDLIGYEAGEWGMSAVWWHQEQPCQDKANAPSGTGSIDVKSRCHPALNKVKSHKAAEMQLRCHLWSSTFHIPTRMAGPLSDQCNHQPWAKKCVTPDPLQSPLAVTSNESMGQPHCTRTAEWTYKYLLRKTGADQSSPTVTVVRCL